MYELLNEISLYRYLSLFPSVRATWFLDHQVQSIYSRSAQYPHGLMRYGVLLLHHLGPSHQRHQRERQNPARRAEKLAWKDLGSALGP
jgi:hypothetical protein